MHVQTGPIQRNTRQRQVILDAVKQSKNHPTADDVYEKVRARLPRVSLGTVYRNLDILAASGDIVRLAPGRTQMRFDGKLEPHYHMTCIHCGRVEDLPMPASDNPVEILEKVTSHLTRYGVFGHKLEFVGVCAECKAKGLEFPETVLHDDPSDPTDPTDPSHLGPNDQRRQP